MQAKPLIGITTYLESARWQSWAAEAVILPATYSHSVEGAGARPLLLPPTAEGVDEALDALDGLVLAGGADLDPALYGDEVHPDTRGFDSERDAAEVPLLRAALERDMPILAICRGMQLLNVACGGTLEQHVPKGRSGTEHKTAPGIYARHEVVIKPDSRLGAALGPAALIASHHHQGLARLGRGLVEVAWAPDDIVEGIEDPTRRWVVGVLWHPEESDQPELFRAFVEAARR